MVITTGAFKSTLKTTLNGVMTDPLDGVAEAAVVNKWCKQSMTSEYYTEYLDTTNPGLLQSKPETTPIQVGLFGEGVVWRFYQAPWALKLLLSRELLDFCQEEKALRPVMRLKRSAWKTIDTLTTLLLVRGFNTAFTFDDGSPLFSTTQPLTGGSTFTNSLAIPTTPSHAALVALQSMALKQVDYTGLPEPTNIKQILHPAEQFEIWKRIFGSTMIPEAGNFAAKNIFASGNGGPDMMSPVTNVFWNDTTTRYAAKTNADGGPEVQYSKKPMGESWMEQNETVMIFSCYMRLSECKVTNKRSMLGSDS